MTKEQEYIKTKNLTAKSALIFYKNIGFTSKDAIETVCKDFNLDFNGSYLYTLISILNEGWKPNLKKLDEKRWLLYFDLDKGFSFWHPTYDHTYTNVPSALYIKDEETVKEAGNNFLDIFQEEYLT